MRNTINFVSYLNPKFYNGGGEAISLEVVKELEKQGYEVKITSIRPFRLNFSLNPRFSIFCDIDNKSAFPRKLRFLRIPLLFLKILSRNAPFVHFLNAYVDICDKNYLPCNGIRKGESCPIDNTVCKAFSKKSRYLTGSASLNVYLSPLHKNICKSLSSKISSRSFVLGPLIDKQRFFKEPCDKDIENLFVGVISEAKGGDALREFSKSNDLTLVGKVEDGFDLNFGTHIPFVKYDEVGAIMRRAKNFIYLPRWPEPQGRVVHEAALCGCNMVLNENVGANSFEFDLDDENSYRNYVKDLVEVLEKL